MLDVQVSQQEENNKSQKKQIIRTKFLIKKILQQTMTKQEESLEEMNEQQEQQQQQDQSVNVSTENIQMKGKNIFKQQKHQDIQNSVQENREKGGPRYNEQGQLVKYSLLGSQDIYEKQKKIQQPNNNMRSQYGADEYLLGQLSKVILQGKDNQALMALKKLNLEKKTGNLKRGEAYVTKAELIKEIKDIEDRIQRNEKLNEKELQYLQYHDYLQWTKDKRVLSNWEKNKKMWNSTVKGLTQSINRNYSDSILPRSEFYRGKKEIIEGLDLLKDDEQKFGSRIWYMQLRNDTQNKTEKRRAELIINDVPQAFQTSFFEKPKTFVTVIRKPTSQSQSYFNTLSGLHTMTSSRTNDYLQNKWMENQKFMSTFMNTQDEELQGLMIEGKNKFNIEKEAFINDGKDLVDLYIRAKNNEENPKSKVVTIDEVIQENYKVDSLQKSTLHLPKIKLK